MSEIESYARAQEYLLGTIDETASRRTEYKLDRMYAFLAALGNPQNRYTCVSSRAERHSGANYELASRSRHSRGSLTS